MTTYRIDQFMSALNSAMQTAPLACDSEELIEYLNETVPKVASVVASIERAEQGRLDDVAPGQNGKCSLIDLRMFALQLASKDMPDALGGDVVERAKLYEAYLV